eukprot:GHVQ01005089.1.p1 GENE.GHVQ01005089.1~~GHVQ01005089.1.p1  ORF type:complete len:220 (+),score=23.46 GHVQ01005089.1:217-876(+)
MGSLVAAEFAPHPLHSQCGYPDAPTQSPPTSSSSTNCVLAISGQIQSCTTARSSPLVCRYILNTGPDWTLVSGTPQAFSNSSHPAHARHIDSSASSSLLHECVFGLPLEAVWSAESSAGWPRIVIVMYGEDWFKRRCVVGYGCVHVPTTCGRHSRVVRLFRPWEGGGWRANWDAWWSGDRPELIDPAVVGRPDGRYLMRCVSSSCSVKVDINVVHREPV